MPTLEVINLPEHVYAQLNYLAEKEHRSLDQEAIVLLKEGIMLKMGVKEKRRKLLNKHLVIDIDGNILPDPVILIREDR